jgi:hypothetical protein
MFFWRHVGSYCPNMANSETFFPVIWRFGVIEEKKKEKESFVLFAPPLFCCQDAKIRPKKNILAAQCLPGFGNPYPLIRLLDHCK